MFDRNLYLSQTNSSKWIWKWNEKKSGKTSYMKKRLNDNDVNATKNTVRCIYTKNQHNSDEHTDESIRPCNADTHGTRLRHLMCMCMGELLQSNFIVVWNATTFYESYESPLQKGKKQIISLVSIVRSGINEKNLMHTPLHRVKQHRDAMRCDDDKILQIHRRNRNSNKYTHKHYSKLIWIESFSTVRPTMKTHARHSTQHKYVLYNQPTALHQKQR